MTRYRIVVTRMEETPGWQTAQHEWDKEHRYPSYGPTPPPPTRWVESPALTFDADEDVFAAIRKAALQSMP